MKSTTRFENNKKGLTCLNCGQPFQGNENFCSECGQVNDDIPLSIKQFVSEFFAGFFSFDSRFLKTLIPLLLKPGKVSKEYIQGKRMKYTNPFQMYLHTSILFFLLTGLISTITSYKNLGKEGSLSKKIKDSALVDTKKEDNNKVKDTFAVKYHQKLDSIFKHTNYKNQFTNDSIAIEIKDSLYQYLFDIGMKNQVNRINVKIAGLKEFNYTKHNRKKNKATVLRELDTYLKENKIRYKVNSKKSNLNIHSKQHSSTIGKFISFSQDNEDLSPEKALDSLGIERTRFNLFKYQKAQEISKIQKDKNFRKAYLKSSISKISIAIFFLLPLLTLFFSILYFRHTYSYTEHLVVVFNLQTVFFLFLIISTLLDTIFRIDFFINIFIFFLFPIYIYKTLRNFYGQKRFKTIIKFLLLSFVSFLLALIGLVLVFFLAFLF